MSHNPSTVFTKALRVAIAIGLSFANAFVMRPASIAAQSGQPAEGVQAPLALDKIMEPDAPMASGVLTVTKTTVGTGSGPFNVTITGPSGFSQNGTIDVGTPLVLTGLNPGIYTVTEATGGYTTVYAVSSGNGYSTSSMAVVTLTTSSTPAAVAITPITGKVFNDYNSDGSITANGLITDTGVAGVTVTAYDAAGNVVGSATTDANGNYTINPSAAGPWRVNFTNLPTGYEPSHSGAQNGTSTQFVTSAAGATNVNFGILLPSSYSNGNPLVVTNLYVNGVATDTTRATLVGQDYLNTGSVQNLAFPPGNWGNVGSCIQERHKDSLCRSGAEAACGVWRGR